MKTVRPFLNQFDLIFEKCSKFFYLHITNYMGEGAKANYYRLNAIA